MAALGWIVLTGALALAGGERYLTEEEALALVFPNGEKVVERRVDLDEEVRTRIARRCGSRVLPVETVYVGFEGDRPAGYAMILSEVTKTLRATFIVGVTPTGEVSEVALLSHEEHIGGDCRKERFLRQFRGKTHGSSVRVGSGGGILPVSGATLSCHAVARGVRKALAIIQAHFVEQPGNLQEAPDGDPIHRKRYVMGTFCTITAFGPREAVEAAFSEIRRLDKVLSNYDPESDLSRLNREGVVQASDDLLVFVERSKRFSEQTEGAFDVTVGPLIRLWGFFDGAFRVPGEDEIAATLGKVGASKVIVEGREIRLPKGGDLDPGAIGKGIAVDRAVEVLRAAGVRRALVDFGSSLHALGAWEAAIRDPFDESGILCRVRLQDESLSTSGHYEKRFERGGVEYTHVIDPRTGRPVQGVASVSVVAPTATESDVLSTSAFVLKSLPEGRDAMLVPVEGPARFSEGWVRRTNEEKE